MLMATLFYALMNMTVKLVPNVPVYEIMFFRALVTLGISYYFIKKAGLNPLGNNKKLLILRGIFGFLSLSLYFLTLQKIPLASAVTLQYLSPIFTTIFAVFFLKQKVALAKWFFFALAFTGVLIIKSTDFRIEPFYLLAGIGSAFFSGLAYNIIAKLKGVDDPMVIIFYFPLVTLPLVTINTISNWYTPNLYEFILLILIGIFTQFGQYYMTKSYQEGPMAEVSIFQYLGIIYALVLGFFVFHENFMFLTLAGMFLVIIAIILSFVFDKIKNNF